MFRRTIVAAAFLLFICPQTVPADVLPPESLNQLSSPCTAAPEGEPENIASAFGYELQSERILNLISAIKNVPQPSQQVIFDAALNSIRSSAQTELSSAQATPCLTSETLHAAARVRYLVTKMWSLRDRTDKKLMTVFSSAVAAAIDALSSSGTSPDGGRDAALAPFARILRNTQKTADLAQTSDCIQPNVKASTIDAVAPDTPRLAARRGTTGSVTITLSLTAQGDVRSARILRDDLHDAPGADEMRDNAIIAAAASTYWTTVKDCRHLAGQYTFSVQYRPRRSIF